MNRLKRTSSSRPGKDTISNAKLAEMIREATVDAYDESELMMGWFTIFEEYFELPFETDVLGVRVTVDSIDLHDDRISAMCRRGRHRLRVGITDLPLPTPKPAGAEWIEAYRQWSSRR